MQAKRILSLLVVVVLTILCGVMSIGAQDNAVNFEYAVEVSASTAIVEEPGLIIKPGETIDVSVTVTANPGIKFMKFAVVYDAAALAPVVDAENKIAYTSGGMFAGFAESVYVDSNNPNKIIYVVDATAADADITAIGTVITLQFTVADDFHGTTGITLDNYKKNVGGGTIAGSKFDSITAKDASVEGYNEASFTTHKYGEPVVAPATCTTPATKTYTCTDANCTDNTLVIETAPALGHTTVVDPAVDPTYDAAGKTEGKHCSVCGEVFVAQEVIPQLIADVEDLEEESSNSWIWIVVIAAVVVLGAAGFGVYWFAIKKNPLPFGKGKDSDKEEKASKKESEEKQTPKAKK